MNNFTAYTSLFTSYYHLWNEFKDLTDRINSRLIDFKNFCMSNKARVKRYKKRGRK